MRLTVVYPSSSEALASLLRTTLSRIAALDLTWIGTDASSYLEDLKEATEDDGALLLVLSNQLIDAKLPPRLAFKPLLEKIEREETSRIGLIELDSVQLPRLLEKYPITAHDQATRSANNWALHWLGHSVAIKQPLCDTLAPLVDHSTIVQVEALSTSDCLEQLQPYFESIEILEAHQQAEPLIQAQLNRIQPQGRILYIVEGYPAPLPSVPKDASILHLPHITAPPVADVTTHAAKLIPQIPNVEGQPLPFSTYHLEHSLPILFEQNWPLAERLARRAGSFFRMNHRVLEALWLYETLHRAALASGQTTCAEFAANELDWLRAGGKSKQKLSQATQGSLFF
ncbi:MAG: hypothetical protein FJW36_06670 [Acidobacteria bacterium]|nr:hypothetical protein [Acidobacteriota bacterium]